MKKIKITQKDILFLSVSMFIIVVAWIAFNLYHTSVTTTISKDLQMQIMPIDPSFDTATIDMLKLREEVQPLSEEKITPTISPKPESEETAPESVTVTPTEEIEVPEAPQSAPTITP